MDEATAATVRRSFSYIFETPPGSSYPALLDDRRIESGRALTLKGPGGPVEVLPFQLDHGEIHSLGYRFGAIAYSPDLKGIPPSSRGYLEGLDVWIVDALRYTQHPSHFSLHEALNWIATLRPRRAILTNLHTDMDYEELKSKLPPNVEPAFDGLTLEARA